MTDKIEDRKLEHIQICLEENIEFENKKTGFQDIEFIHRALPELDFNEIDTSVFISYYQKHKEANKVDFTFLSNKLSEIPLAEWGLVVKDIYPKSDEDYIEETIYLYNSSPTTRRAVVEQIITKLPKEKIKNLLKKMDEYKNSLEGLEKTEYEVYSKDTYDWIKELL